MAKPEDVLSISKPRRAAVPVARTYEAGLADGASNERLRIASILESEPAQARQLMARRIALTTSLTPDAAAALLESAAPEANPYLQAMESEAIGIGPGLGGAPVRLDARDRRMAELQDLVRHFNDARAGRPAPRGV